jgi:hypothetical protein
VAALFTKFDPRAFLDAERHAADGGGSAKLATLAALAGPTPNSENWPGSDADLSTGLPVENLRAGVRAAKPAKSAKDGQQLGLATSSDAGQACATVRQAAWSPEDWRARFDERAGFLEHDGGLLRLEAEVQAFDQCIVEWLNTNPSSTLAGRCAWCGRPESPSAVVLPFGIEPGTHASLHADCWAAWHQSRRQEAALALRKMGIAPVSSSGGHLD